MSSLLAGPSSINPWIEDVCFHALTQRRGPITPAAQRPRLVQVRAMRLSLHSARPSLLVIHDGKTLVVAFIQTALSSSVKRGCIVRISDWKVSLVERCTTHLQEALHPSNGDIVSSFLNPNPRICLNVGKVEVLGGHGIGMVGNPTAVHQSVEVRRALMNLESKGISLEQQLQLVGSCSSTPRLGNVQELFANDENRNMIDTLLAVPKDGFGGTSGKQSATIPPTNNTNGTSSEVVLGDVSGLLESLRNDSSDTNFVARIMNQSSKRANNPDRNTATKQARTNSNTVLGNVRVALAAGTDYSMADALFAAANGSSSTTRQEQQQDSTRNTSVAKQARQVEPYGIRERFESRSSVVSISGISNVLRSLVAGRNSFLEPEQKDNGVEEAKEQKDNGPEYAVHGNEKETPTQTHNATETRETDSDSDSEVLGISDMLVSQTQEVPEDDFTTQETSKGNTRTDTDKVEAETTTQVTRKVVPGSNVDHVETVAMDDSDTPLDAFSVTNHNKTNVAIEPKSTLQDAVIEKRGAVAGSNVYCVETVDPEMVNKETTGDTRVIKETSVKQNTRIDQETLVEQPSETESSKKRPFEEEVEETIANEIQYATQPEIQPPLQPRDEDEGPVNDDNDDDTSRAHGDTNVARLAVPKKAQVSTNSKRPKKKRRKGMLNLWKDIRQRRKEKQQSDE